MTGLGSQKPPKMSSKWVQNGSKINKKTLSKNIAIFHCFLIPKIIENMLKFRPENDEKMIQKIIENRIYVFNFRNKMRTCNVLFFIDFPYVFSMVFVILMIRIS